MATAANLGRNTDSGVTVRAREADGALAFAGGKVTMALATASIRAEHFLAVVATEFLRARALPVGRARAIVGTVALDVADSVLASAFGAVRAYKTRTAFTHLSVAIAHASVETIAWALRDTAVSGGPTRSACADASHIAVRGVLREGLNAGAVARAF